MSPFVLSLGRAFAGTALRRLAEQFQSGATEWFIERGIVAPLRTGGALLLLQERGPQGVVEIATQLRQSHPTIISWIKELERLGLIRSRPSELDGRRTVISLTKAGEVQAELIRAAQNVLASAYVSLCAEAGVDIFDGLLRMEDLCRRRPMIERLREQAEEFDLELSSSASQAG